MLTSSPASSFGVPANNITKYAGQLLPPLRTGTNQLDYEQDRARVCTLSTSNNPDRWILLDRRRSHLIACAYKHVGCVSVRLHPSKSNARAYSRRVPVLELFAHIRGINWPKYPKLWRQIGTILLHKSQINERRLFSVIARSDVSATVPLALLRISQATHCISRMPSCLSFTRIR